MPKTTLLYYFAHMYLRKVVFSEQNFLRSLIDEGREALRATLTGNFERIRFNEGIDLDERDIELGPDDLTSMMDAIEDNGGLVLLIKFPAPRNTSEVAYVGIVFGKEPHYYMMELSRRPSQDKISRMSEELQAHFEHVPKHDRFFFCSWTKEGTHQLHHVDVFDEPDPVLFMQAINKYYTLRSETQSE